MSRFLRLYGKKRGQRMTGWWLVGRVGEAFWFATICVVSVLVLSTIVAWQVYSPDTHPFPVGYGFWLLVLVSSFFVGIGAVGFIFRVLQVAYSDEHRSVLASAALPANRLNGGNLPKRPPMVPDLTSFTDSPGERLAFRLPSFRPELRELVLGSIFVLAWDGLVAVLAAIAISRLRYGQIEWFLWLFVLPAFGYVGFRVTRWFFRIFRRATGIGPTLIEIDEFPLISGRTFQLYVAQYGRLSMKKLTIALVCEELATYHFGTDTRTERQEVYRRTVFEQGRCRIEWGRPLEITCSFRLPDDAMHSFRSPHNSVAWNIVVEGDANRWPSYCRNFPVVVYPHPSPAKIEAEAS